MSQPLQAGCTYQLSCWVRVACPGEFGYVPSTASDNLAAYFTSTRFSTGLPDPIIGPQPQALLLAPGQLVLDTLNYTYLSSTFVAQGGERYFTLGNFQPDAATTVRKLKPYTYEQPWARYAIDDVAVEAVPPAALRLALGAAPWLGPCPGAAPVTLTAGPGFQGYRWSTGATTASIQVSQPGRYVVTADFGCGLLKDSVEVRRFDPQRQRLLTPPAPLCPGQPGSLTALAGLRDYQWDDGPAGPTRVISQPGRYRLSAHTQDGCLLRDSVDVQLLPAPVIPPGLPRDTLLCEQQSWRLTLPPPPPGLSYEWNAGTPSPTLLVPADGVGVYTLTVRSACQTAQATLRVRRQDCAPILQIPNIVTPNSDGYNERFRVSATGVHALRLRVFDRWGQLVFESAAYQDQWPAERMPSGLYYYLLEDETYGRRYRGYVEVAP